MDNRLFHAGKDYYLITAGKKGHNLFDPSLVDLTIYRFKESQDDPGVPRYEWSAYKSLVTKNAYESATEAYQELLSEKASHLLD
jgi:hypothetical protein